MKAEGASVLAGLLLTQTQAGGFWQAVPLELCFHLTVEMYHLELSEVSESGLFPPICVAQMNKLPGIW